MSNQHERSRPCRVGGCRVARGENHRGLCTSHFAAWSNSQEAVRYFTSTAANIANVHLADFIRRVEAEERNAGPGGRR